mmetsp:Transcript_26598/g.39524  ORF Transcript_26598/g.39524 Transcript_26598/m.39524 type:complete len:682 (-) Transcript_26598:121-2166(-)|eukprot:CAMPEP_0185029452 /NCGR_PEP_ID=MMETSP1103-20130426/15755_1 /TAXON_ID=36769 /ORGANISM="Paraphysomonas bandaiensis, Strain Caron Lab Isolate" /LENGTH=681 /DNA_ID=CAMNT_0027564201 /DNA_START=118 /DNA_END=2166 /DNA_ORIENTATION=+
MRSRGVTIVVVGDAGTGKTSLIKTFISKSFPAFVEPVAPDEIIPSMEPMLPSEGVTLLDTSAALEDREILLSKLHVADTVIVLFDASHSSTLTSVTEVWLPLVKEVFQDDPCKAALLVRTKSDLLSDEELLHVDVTHNAVLNSYKESFPFVYGTYRSSALANPDDVESLFALAEGIAIFPLAPLYDIRTDKFTDPALRALKRIFRIHDCDSDGCLSDYEFRDLQLRCFGISLSDEELRAIKRMLPLKACSQWRNRVLASDTGNITFIGFLTLMEVGMAQSPLPYTPWRILMHHEYDYDLQCPVPAEDDDDEGDREIVDEPRLTYALSPAAERFLCALVLQDPAFTSTLTQAGTEKIDRVEEALSVLPPVYRDIWKSTPALSGKPGLDPECTPVVFSKTSRDCIEAWINQWQVLAVQRPTLTKELLLHMGLSDCFFLERISVPRGKSRSVSRLSVFSPPSDSGGVLSASVVCGLAGVDPSVMTGTTHSGVSGGFFRTRGKDRATAHFVASAVPTGAEYDWIKKTEPCHLALLVFDARHVSSFEYVRDLDLTVIPTNVPRIFICAKLPEPISGDSSDGATSSEEEGGAAYDMAVQHVRERGLPQVEKLFSLERGVVSQLIQTIDECVVKHAPQPDSSSTGWYSIFTSIASFLQMNITPVLTVLTIGTTIIFRRHIWKYVRTIF